MEKKQSFCNELLTFCSFEVKYRVYYFCRGMTAPSGSGPLQYRIFTITHNDTSQTLGLLWTSDQPESTDIYLSTHNNHKRETSMPPAVFENHKPNKRAVADSSLRPRGHWDRQVTFRLLNLKKETHWGREYIII
jgi:hypothetical protein